jgi:beta-lactamase superfamily II metal-dependent hydrolase
LDVGQGSCVYVDCPDGARPIIIDCGTKGRSIGAGNNGDTGVTTNWIAGELDRLQLAPRIVVSHADTDHFNRIAAAVAPERAPDVYLGSPYAHHEDDFRIWLDRVDEEGGALHYFAARSAVHDHPDLRCGGAIADVLIANATGGAVDNADSVVLALSYQGVSFVFAGDAEGHTRGEDRTEPLALATRRQLPRLLENRIILSASHHGADTEGSNGLAWVQAWNESDQLYAVSFSARPTTHGHPACNIVERYHTNMAEPVDAFPLRCSRSVTRSVSRRMLSAHENGHILIRIGAGEIAIFCEVPTPACSGSIPAGLSMPGRSIIASNRVAIF